MAMAQRSGCGGGGATHPAGRRRHRRRRHPIEPGPQPNGPRSPPPCQASYSPYAIPITAASAGPPIWRALNGEPSNGRLVPRVHEPAVSTAAASTRSCAWLQHHRRGRSATSTVVARSTRRRTHITPVGQRTPRSGEARGGGSARHRPSPDDPGPRWVPLASAGPGGAGVAGVVPRRDERESAHDQLGRRGERRHAPFVDPPPRLGARCARPGTKHVSPRICRWCDTVDWPTSIASTTSPVVIGRASVARRCRMRMRVGSPSALNHPAHVAASSRVTVWAGSVTEELAIDD